MATRRRRRSRRNANKFQKILIANRGEIALRIIRACREMDIRTVAVFSTADADSLHVRFADEAVCVGPPSSAESYLNVSRILSAADVTQADAIHPGYGFLAENDEFAAVCKEMGIVFIGPTPESMRIMGDKVEARLAAEEAGLPTVPGTGVIRSVEEGREAAKKIGFPVLIKASAGGGGRGMKVVRSASRFQNSYKAARTEANAAFGNDDVYIEKLITNPRHIEFQVVADNHGNVAVLGERDCSVQRRHQKIIEESPSPKVTPKLRAEMSKVVSSALKKLKYQNVGTVEFLMDSDSKLYFIEMNTRIQVEHPVTEMVTGIDLIRLQIELAAGAKLTEEVTDCNVRGHAIECRVVAEHPETFQPSPGTITGYHAPGGFGVRVDSAVCDEYVVHPFYDSMLAKLIVHGRTREEALQRSARALDEFVIEGIQTNIPLLKRIVTDKRFIRGNYGTRFLERLL